MDVLEKTETKQGIRIITTDIISTMEICGIIYKLTEIYNLSLFLKTTELPQIVDEGNRFAYSYKFTKSFEKALKDRYDFNKKDGFMTKFEKLELDLNMSAKYFGNGYFDISTLINKYPSQYWLNIVKMHRNSPLTIDLLGIGEIVKQVKEFILEVYDRKINKKNAELKKLTDQEHIKTLQLDNIEKYLSICKKYAMSYEDLSIIMKSLNSASNDIENLINDKKIKEFKFISEQEMKN